MLLRTQPGLGVAIKWIGDSCNLKTVTHVRILARPPGAADYIDTFRAWAIGDIKDDPVKEADLVSALLEWGSDTGQWELGKELGVRLGRYQSTNLRASFDLDVLPLLTVGQPGQLTNFSDAMLAYTGEFQERMFGYSDKIRSLEELFHAERAKDFQEKVDSWQAGKEVLMLLSRRLSAGALTAAFLVLYQRLGLQDFMAALQAARAAMDFVKQMDEDFFGD